jgi:hypothetical protein
VRSGFYKLSIITRISREGSEKHIKLETQCIRPSMQLLLSFLAALFLSFILASFWSIKSCLASLVLQSDLGNSLFDEKDGMKEKQEQRHTTTSTQR